MSNAPSACPVTSNVTFSNSNQRMTDDDAFHQSLPPLNC
jgi:hypothetical protein